MQKWVILIAAMCLCCVNVQGAFFYFDRITYNTQCGDAVGSQLSVDVTDEGNGAIGFLFFNANPTGYIESVISEIYFYDGALLAMSSVDDSCWGVDFEDIGDKTNPKGLPGYNSDVDFLEVFSAIEADNPEPANGVGPGEWLSIDYTLRSGKTYLDVLNELSQGQIVIGLHVKAIECDPVNWDNPELASLSESYITIPELPTLVILGTGIAAMRLVRKKY